MAIIHITHNVDYVNIVVGGVFTDRVKAERIDFPEGAYCSLDWDHARDGGFRNSSALVLYSTHHGRCISERERNGYDDSDFYMLVWNDEGGFAHEIQFATTRGWSYPCYGSAVDATPETLAKYEAWCAEQVRRNKVKAKWAFRKHRREFAKVCGITTTDYDRLRACYGPETMTRLYKLLSSKLRSSFRIKMAAQVRQWLADPSPKYQTPFSHKQLDYI